MDSSPEARLERATVSLEGLSVGDAFGERFFMSFELAAELMGSGEFGGPPYNFEDDFIRSGFVDPRRIPPGPARWRWTDDTALALEIVDNLRRNKLIDPGKLARRFAVRYSKEPTRGYGAAMHSLLPQLYDGEWEVLASGLFHGKGSYGNGAAMRAAPVGAYFADDLDAVVENSALSARVTHAHSEGVAGAVAVALGAALCARASLDDQDFEPEEFLEEVVRRLAPGELRKRCQKAQEIDDSWTGEEVAEELGAGQEVAAWDTVPFCLWCTAHFRESYEEALWVTLSGLGDRDTTCAITGGMVAAGTGIAAIPPQWRAAREALDI